MPKIRPEYKAADKGEEGRMLMGYDENIGIEA